MTTTNHSTKETVITEEAQKQAYDLIDFYLTTNEGELKTVHAQGWEIKTNWVDKALVITPDKKHFALFNDEAHIVIDVLQDDFYSAWGVIEILTDVINYDPEEITA